MVICGSSASVPFRRAFHRTTRHASETSGRSQPQSEMLGNTPLEHHCSRMNSWIASYTLSRIRSELQDAPKSHARYRRRRDLGGVIVRHHDATEYDLRSQNKVRGIYTPHDELREAARSTLGFFATTNVCMPCSGVSRMGAILFSRPFSLGW
jgi:hypothetical protein